MPCTIRQTPGGSTSGSTDATYNRRVRAALVVVITVLSASLSAQRPAVCPQEYLDLRALNAIGRATSCKAIDEAFRQVVAPDGVTRLVYAAHRARRCPGSASNELLIRSLPSDEITFSLLYSLTYPSDVIVIEKSIDELASGLWLQLALEAVIEQGRGGRAFLMQAYLGSSNADISEMFPGLHEELRRRAPKTFAAAVRALPEAAKKYVYDDER